MARPYFDVVIDHEQARLAKPRIISVAAGFHEPENRSVKPQAGWDFIGSVDAVGDLTTFVDPVTGTLMLRPAPMSRLWDTTGSGIYARLAIANFTFNDSSKWYESNDSGAVSKFLYLKDSTAATADRSAVSTATYAANRGFYVGFFGFSWNDSNVLILEYGWNSTASDASGVSLKIYLNGNVEVYKDGELIERGNLRSQEAQTEKGAQVANQVVALFAIPFRKAELLVISNLGGAFTAFFDDIDQTEDDPAITAATNFWFKYSDAAGKAAIEIAPLSYPSTGWRASVPSTKIDAPGSGLEPIHTILSHGNTVAASLVTVADATIAFVPDGVLNSWRTKATLTAGGTTSPHCFAVLSEFLPETEFTPGPEIPLQQYLMALDISVPESPSGVTIGCTVKSPDAIDAGDAQRFLSIGNRPAKLSILPTSVDVVDGAMSCPKASVAHSDEITFCTFEIRDLWQRLENCMFTDEVPFDTLDVGDAVAFILEYAGIPDSYFDIEAVGVAIEGPTGSGSRNDFVCKAEIGDTCDQWIQRLHEDFCATWFYGFVPTADGIKFKWTSPETLGNTPKLTLYDQIADVPATPDGKDENWQIRQTYRTLDQESLDPECNRIVVTGLDLRTRLPILRVFDDEESQNPALGPSDRPDNWLGEIRQVGFRSPQLTTGDLCDEAVRLLRKRLTVRRFLVEIECEMLFDPTTETDYIPIWRGDVITLNGYGDYRVLSFTASMESEPDASAQGYSDRSWRSAKYVLEKIVEGTAEGLGGNAMATSIEGFRATNMLGVYVRTRTTVPMEVERRRPAGNAAAVV